MEQELEESIKKSASFSSFSSIESGLEYQKDTPKIFMMRKIFGALKQYMKDQAYERFFRLFGKHRFRALRDVVKQIKN